MVTFHYNCLGEVSAGVLWTKKLYRTFHRHEGKWIMTEFLFLGELSLLGLVVLQKMQILI